MRSVDAAPKYSVSASRVYDLRKKRRETGSIAPVEYKRGAKLKLAPYEKKCVGSLPIILTQHWKNFTHSCPTKTMLPLLPFTTFCIV